MKPFNEHVNDLVDAIPGQILKTDVPFLRVKIERALRELARDQRHVCAEAVIATEDDFSFDKAHQAVMNAPLP